MATLISQLIDNARKAQAEFAGFSQEQVDTIVKTIAKTIYDNAVELAKMAVTETKMGVFADKVTKNQNKAKTIWNSLQSKKSVDIIDVDPAKGLVYIAKPIGVVGAITPCTNPIVTPMSNAMFALKGKNAIIIAPHPKAKKCGAAVVTMINKAIATCGAPKNLVQIIAEPSIELANELMQAVNVVVATGGMGMVKASYRSGKPALGVGTGNVQCIIDKGVDFKEVIPKIISGRAFDNGIICSGEQSVIIAAEDYASIIDVFKANGGYYIENAEEQDAIRKTLFVDGNINNAVVGQSVQKITQLAGIQVPADAKVLLVEAKGFDAQDVLCKEKMCPVLAIFKYRDFSEAINIAEANLNVEGKGHSCVIHSVNQANIEYAGKALSISRLVVNQPCSTSAGGSFYNGFAPTTSLGCGSWGNNSVSENITYKHLINISQIGYYLKDKQVPTDEELWGA